jgi:hypothetical protein
MAGEAISQNCCPSGEQRKAKRQEHQRCSHGNAFCSGQKQWDKTKRKGRCKCHANSEGEGQGQK